jgi:hypothetical protein
VRRYYVDSTPQNEGNEANKIRRFIRKHEHVREQELTGKEPGDDRETMKTYEFTMRIDREVSESEVDALYSAFHDGSVMTGPGQTEIEFAREAPSVV